MAQYLETFDYSLNDYSQPYAINNGTPSFVAGKCRLPTNSFINKDFNGPDAWSFHGQNYVGNYAISFDLDIANVNNAIFLILNYGGTDLVPALLCTPESFRFGWSAYGAPLSDFTGNIPNGEFNDGDFNGQEIYETGLYRITYIKRVLGGGASNVAMHVVSPHGNHFKTGWVSIADPVAHNQIGNNTWGTGYFEIGTISVIDELSETDLGNMRLLGEDGYTGSVALPGVSSAGGTYNEPITITASCATTGATIYYTTDGTDPTTSSSIFSGSVVLGPSLTPVNVRLFAAKDGLPASGVLSVTYQFVCATPTATPSAGTFGEVTPVTLACTTPGASIYYTTDGTEPTTSSTLYTTPVDVQPGVSTTLRFMAAAAGYNQSTAQQTEYNVSLGFVETWDNLNNWWVDKPGWLSLPGNGTLVSVGNNTILKLLNPVLDIFVVEVIVATPDDALIYFINAYSTATNFYDLISGEFQFGVLLENGYGSYIEDIVLSWQEGSLQQTAIAKFTPEHSYRLLFGKINTELMLKVFDAQTGDLVVEATRTLLVSNDQVKLLIGAGRAGSVWGPMSFRYSLTQEQAQTIIETGDITAGGTAVEAPVFSPTSTVANSVIDVTLSCGTPGAEIRYTLDGSIPTLSSPLYTGPISVMPYQAPVGSHISSTVLGQSVPAVVMHDGNMWTTTNLAYKTTTLGRNWNDADDDDGYGTYYTRSDLAALAALLDNGWRLPSIDYDVYMLRTAIENNYPGNSASVLRDAGGFNALMSGFRTPTGEWVARGEYAPFMVTGDDISGSPTVHFFGCFAAATEIYTQSLNEIEAEQSLALFAMPVRLVHDTPFVPTTTVRARAFLSGNPSTTSQETYTFTVPAPVVAPASGIYAAPVSVVVSNELSYASLRYTLNGIDPTEESFLYTDSFQIPVSDTPVVLKVQAFATGFNPSGVVTRTYSFSTAEPRIAHLRIRDFSLGSRDVDEDVLLVLE